jgi:hypothetical protein
MNVVIRLKREIMKPHPHPPSAHREADRETPRRRFTQIEAIVEVAVNSNAQDSTITLRKRYGMLRAISPIELHDPDLDGQK